MPRYIHCRVCGKRSPKKWGFGNRMKWLRRHRKKRHPTAHRQSVIKSLRTKRKRGLIDKSGRR